MRFRLHKRDWTVSLDVHLVIVVLAGGGGTAVAILRTLGLGIG
jgi:hypothetical protein